jgi:hypothetical protein
MSGETGALFVFGVESRSGSVTESTNDTAALRRIRHGALSLGSFVRWSLESRKISPTFGG